MGFFFDVVKPYINILLVASSQTFILQISATSITLTSPSVHFSEILLSR